MPQRIAMLSDHASPLAAVGGIDSGGQNIYVAETARYLAARGYLVDVFTRKDQPELPEVVDWLPGVRVIHVPAGPAAFVRKEDVLPLMPEFAAFVQGVRGHAALRPRACALLHVGYGGVAAEELARLAVRRDVSRARPRAAFASRRGGRVPGRSASRSNAT